MTDELSLLRRCIGSLIKRRFKVVLFFGFLVEIGESWVLKDYYCYLSVVWFFIFFQEKVYVERFVIIDY